MREYRMIYSPLKEDWCVPASLQTVLHSREIKINQEEIARSFPKYFEEGSFRGFQFNEELLRSFLERFGLNCSFSNPFMDFLIYHNEEEFLKQTNGDVLIGYDARFINGNIKDGQNSHLSIVGKIGEGSESGKVRIMDPIMTSRYIPLSLILGNMHPDLNSNYGFYIVSDK